MKVCPKCGTLNDDNAVVCVSCGTSVTFEGANQQQYNQQQYAPQGSQQYYAPQGNQQYYAPQGNQQYSQQQYNQPNDQQGNAQYNYQQFNYQPLGSSELNELKKDVSTATYLGYASIVAIFFMQLATIICGLIGMSKAKSAMQEAERLNDPMLLKKAKDAHKMNKIAVLVVVGITVLATVGTLVMYIFSIGLFSSGYLS